MAGTSGSPGDLRGIIGVALRATLTAETVRRAISGEVQEGEKGDWGNEGEMTDETQTAFPVIRGGT
jgi:hypothetical protein